MTKNDKKQEIKKVSAGGFKTKDERNGIFRFNGKNKFPSTKISAFPV